MAGGVMVEGQVTDAHDPVSETRDEAVVDNVARHLRAHPDARVRDDRGRTRPLTAQEADRLARVALRAVRPWLAVAPLPVTEDAMALRVVSARAARTR